MKYLCLVYYDEKDLDALSKSEFDALVGESLDYDDVLEKGAHLVAANALEAVNTATTLRIRNGRISATDGPFAETKEQLGGIYLIEARDLNDAIQIAGRIPAAREGSIEVRPVWDLRRHEPRVGRD